MWSLVVPAVLGGLTNGAIYALVALGLTLIYGVLHIINFAHGSLLMLAESLILLLHDLSHLRHPVRQIQDDFQQLFLGIFLQPLLELLMAQKPPWFLYPDPQQGQDMGANLLPLRLGAVALVGKLVILNLHLHREGLWVKHHAPEAIGQSVTMPNLMLLDHDPGLGLTFRAADLVQSLGL